jgi:aromatic ring-opening dioxygenase LigB subunit
VDTIGCACPHPPLLIPEIGRQNIAEVEATDAAMRRLGAELGEVDLTIVISPHTPGFSDVFTVKSPRRLSGDFRGFGVPSVGLEIDNDTEFVDRLVDRARTAGIELEPVADADLDHGILVPMYFVKARRLVSLSIVMDYAAHAPLGALVRACADELDRRALFLASGDLSHRLLPGAPAGYDERGKVFDREVADLLGCGDFAGLATMARETVRGAGECGLRSLLALGGFLGDDAIAQPELLSYEGPFGVGYAVARFAGAAA